MAAHKNVPTVTNKPFECDFIIAPDAMVTILGFDFYVMAVTGYAANGSVYVNLASAIDNDARTMALVRREDIRIG